MRLTSARSMPLAELMALFNSVYSDYSVPLTFDEGAFQRHLADNDIDLEVSRVALASSPVGLALIGLRGQEAWVGGMGTVPACRRRGLAGRTLDAALEAAAMAGAEEVRLEVLEHNSAAISLYKKLGFTVTRHLIVCSLQDPGTPDGDWQAMSVDESRRWCAEHRASREPWQRDDPVLTAMPDSGRPLAAIGIKRSRRLAAVAIYTEAGGRTLVVQMVALDDSAAAEGLRAVKSATGQPVVLANFPTDEPVAAGVARLGISPDLIQYEMRLRLAT